MKKSLVRKAVNRFLHVLARTLPGATTFRPFIHRLRGMKIGQGVFIGDEVYLENEYPEAVEIQDGVQISVRAIILAHTRGLGKVVIEKDAFVGPNAVIVTSGSQNLRVGEGAVVGAGVVVARDVPPRIFLPSPASAPLAEVRVPLTRVEKMEDFVRGLVPLPRRSSAATAVVGPSPKVQKLANE
jgi:hypothetical protein